LKTVKTVHISPDLTSNPRINSGAILKHSDLLNRFNGFSPGVALPLYRTFSKCVDCINSSPDKIKIDPAEVAERLTKHTECPTEVAEPQRSTQNVQRSTPNVQRSTQNVQRKPTNE